MKLDAFYKLGDNCLISKQLHKMVDLGKALRKEVSVWFGCSPVKLNFAAGKVSKDFKLTYKKVMEEGKMSSRKMLIALTILAVAMTTCQGAMAGDYHRKAVSIVETAAVTNSTIRLSSEQSQLFMEAFRDKFMEEQYDVLALPDVVQQELRSQIYGKIMSAEQLREIIDRVARPKLEGIMETTAKERAERDNPHWDRTNFITEKANSLGITIEDLERMMKCGYLFIPYLSKLEAKGSGESIKMVLKGGVHWFHLEFEGMKGRMVHIKSISSSGEAGKSTYGQWVGQLKQSLSTGGRSKQLPAQLKAFRNASYRLAENLSTKSRREIIALRRTGRVMSFSKGDVEFNLGKKEGLIIDDRYALVDFNEDKDGKVYASEKGFGMVRRVGDNRKDKNVFSHAKPIIGGGRVQEGLELMEIPMSAYDLSVKLGWRSLKVDGVNVSDGSVDYITLNEATSTGIMTVGADLQMNVGRGLGIPQLFVCMGATFGYAPVDLKVLDSEDLKQGILIAFQAGLAHRYYLGRISLVLGVDGTYNSMSFGKTVDDVDYILRRSFFGGIARAGIDFTVTPSLNIGLRGGYALHATGEGWKFEVDEEEMDWFDGESMEVEFDGPYASLVVSYTLPSLFWSPF